MSWRLLLPATAAALLAVYVVGRGPAPADVRPAALAHMMAAPSVAFLPAPLTVRQDDLLDIVDEITTEIRRIPRGFDLAVKLAPSETKTDQSIDKIAASLDVRYLVRAAPTRTGDGAQVAVQIIEGPTSRQVWASTYALGETPRVALPSRIARDIAVQIRTAEHQRALPPAPLAGHYVLQGRVLLESERNAEVNQRSMALFDRAVKLDPRSIQAQLGYARTRVVAVTGGHAKGDERMAYLAAAEAAVATVLAIDKGVAGAQLIRGAIARLKGNYAGAQASFEQALLHSPNYMLAHAELGRLKHDMGRPLEAIDHIERALVLSPGDPVSSNWLYWAGMAAVELGRDEQAIKYLHRALQANPRNTNPQPWIAIATARLGRDGDARALLKDHMAKTKSFTVERWLQIHGRSDSKLLTRLAPFAALLITLGAPPKI